MVSDLKTHGPSLGIKEGVALCQGSSQAGEIHFQLPLSGNNSASSEVPFLAHQHQWESFGSLWTTGDHGAGATPLQGQPQGIQISAVSPNKEASFLQPWFLSPGLVKI